MEFSAERYRCVPVQIASHFRVTVENYSSWKDGIGGQCESRVVDVVEPNFYGALTSRCSRRKTDADERFSEYSTSKVPEAQEKELLGATTR